MSKRILVLLISLTLCLPLPALAMEAGVESPVPDNQTLFLSSLSDVLEGCDPFSRKLTLYESDPDGNRSLVLQPAQSGLRLDLSENGDLLGALEVGQEALWVLWEGRTLEVPFSLFTSFAQGAGGASQGSLPEDFLAKYRAPLTAWAMKAYALLSPMVTVSDTSRVPFHVHVHGDARQLAGALVSLMDCILGDTDTVSALLEDLGPMLRSRGLEEMPDADQLLLSWQDARGELLSQPLNAALTLDADINPGGRMFSLSGCLTAEGEPLLFDALLYPGSSWGTYSFTASLYGGALEGSRADLKLEKVLSSSSRAAMDSACTTYKVDGSFTVKEPNGRSNALTLEMTETEGSTRMSPLFAADGTLDSLMNGRSQGSVDFGLSYGAESLSLRASMQNIRGETGSLRVFLGRDSGDLRLDTPESALSLALDTEGAGYLRFYQALSGQEFNELVYDGEKAVISNSLYEIKAWAEYSSPDHMILWLTQTNWSDPDRLLTARVDVTLPGGEEGCVLRMIGTDVEGTEAFRVELLSVPASPAPSLGENGDKTVLTQEMLLQLLSSSPAPAMPAATPLP